MRNPAQIVSGSIFATFVNQELNTSVGKMHDIQIATEGLYQLNTADEATFVQYQNNVHFIISAIVQKDNLLGANPDPATAATLLSEKAQLLNNLQNEVSNWNNFKSQKESVLYQNAAQIAQENQTIVVATTHESNEKTVNDIYLQTFAVALEPSPAQIALLEGIANQCPLVGGAAVYRARALIGQANYDDYMLCRQALPRESNQSATDKTAKNTLEIYPNPVCNQLQLLLPNHVKTIVITNQLGSVIQSWKDETFEQRWQADINLPSGVYFCTIETDMERITKPFVVVKK
jgi:hypothetical protein